MVLSLVCSPVALLVSLALALRDLFTRLQVRILSLQHTNVGPALLGPALLSAVLILAARYMHTSQHRSEDASFLIAPGDACHHRVRAF